MFRFAGQILALAPVVFTVAPAFAAPTADSALAIVTGIAPGDLLNVREAASPMGHVRTRLGNGTGVRNFGCTEVNGYQWCKVAVADQPNLEGWVPSRYLLAVDPESTATPALDEAELKAAAADASALALPAETAGMDNGTGAAANAAHPSEPNVPVGLAARFGNAPANGAPTALGLPAAVSEAYRLAFASQAEAMAKKMDVATVAPTQDAGSPVAASTESDGPAAEVEAAANVPIPTPRPDLEAAGPRADAAGQDSPDGAPVQVASATAAAGGAPTASETSAPQIVALADPQSATAWDATGEIPCARYVGQPMTHCKVGIRRDGAGKADITVTWPDGGTRLIGFYEGKPAGTNARGEFRFTREGDLNMIRVGVSERFEITDGLAFGD